MSCPRTQHNDPGLESLRYLERSRPLCKHKCNHDVMSFAYPRNIKEPSRNLLKPWVPGRIGIWKMLVSVEGGGGGWGEPDYLEKNPRSNQQQTQPKFDADSENRTRVTLVGDECSHHCVIPNVQVKYLA